MNTTVDQEFADTEAEKIIESADIKVAIAPASNSVQQIEPSGLGATSSTAPISATPAKTVDSEAKRAARVAAKLKAMSKPSKNDVMSSTSPPPASPAKIEDTSSLANDVAAKIGAIQTNGKHTTEFLSTAFTQIIIMLVTAKFALVSDNNLNSALMLMLMPIISGLVNFGYTLARTRIKSKLIQGVFDEIDKSAARKPVLK